MWNHTNPPVRGRSSARPAWVLASACLLGCGDSGDVDRKPVSPVRGEVFADGEPAAGAMITFHPAATAKAGSLRSQAVVDGEGKFALSTYVAGDGAPEGGYVVTVYWPDRRREKRDMDGENEELPPDRLRGQYSSPQTSPLRAAVGRGPVAFARVDLEDEAVRTAKEFRLIEKGGR